MKRRMVTIMKENNNKVVGTIQIMLFVSVVSVLAFMMNTLPSIGGAMIEYNNYGLGGAMNMLIIDDDKKTDNNNNNNNNNPWFGGVIDTFNPLLVLKKRDNNEGGVEEEETEIICTMSPFLTDIQDKVHIEDDVIASNLLPYAMMGGRRRIRQQQPPSSYYYYYNNTYYGGITNQNHFIFPCPMKEVRFETTQLTSDQWYGFNKPKDEWKYLVDDLLSTKKWNNNNKDDDEPEHHHHDNTTSTEILYYSCTNVDAQTFTLGIDPKFGLQQIKTARKYFDEMEYYYLKNNSNNNNGQDDDDNDILVEKERHVRHQQRSQQRQKQKNRKQQQQPPDIYLIVLDMTSRASFHRSFPSVVADLRRKVDDGIIDVFEMFRYSVVGKGTWPNMRVMLQGCETSDGLNTGLKNHGLQCDDTTVPLHLWYAAAGYVLLGKYPYLEDMTFQFGEVLSGAYWFQTQTSQKYGRTQMDVYVDWLIEQKSFYEQNAPDLPQYFAVHINDNHDTDHDGLMGQASSLDRLLDSIDFENRNAMVFFVGDHGKYHGPRFGTSLGSFESNNPVLLAVASPGVLSSSQTDTWRNNQQRLTTHWDFHATLKSLPLQYGTGWPNVESYCESSSAGGDVDKTGQSTCGPISYHASRYRNNDANRTGALVPFQKNMFLSEIPNDRTCEDAKSIDECVCRNIPGEERRWKESERLLVTRLIASELNQWTGNGQLYCREQYGRDLMIKKTISSYKVGVAFHTVMVVNEKSKAAYAVHLNETTIDGILQVEYIYNRYGQYAPGILRQDRFDEEHCLITDKDGYMPKFKANETALLERNDLNLRWCSCK